MSTEAVVPIAGATVTVTITSRAAEAEAYVRAVRPSFGSKMVVGLDAEWSSASRPGGKVALLQLCSGVKCLIVQLRHLDYVPQSLKDFLADPGVTFVGVGITEDVAKLGRDYGLSCKNAVELGPLAAKSTGNLGSTGASLVDLARRVLGLTIEKSASVARSDWESVSLSFEQVMYATTDAYVGYLLGVSLGAN